MLLKVHFAFTVRDRLETLKLLKLNILLYEEALKL